MALLNCMAEVVFSQHLFHTVYILCLVIDVIHSAGLEK
jgi:hypothetical protein